MSARFPAIAFRLAALSALAGSLCLVASVLIEPKVDAQGMLHEPFFLIPLGLFLLAIGILLGLTAWLTRARVSCQDDQITKEGNG